MSDLATCPVCRQALRVPPSLLGQRLKCPACANDFDPVPPAPRRDEPREERRRYDPPPPRDENLDDDYPRPRRLRDRGRDRNEPKPGKVQAVAVMMLVGGIFALMTGVAIPLFSCGFGLLWPGTYLAIVTGILCLVKSGAWLGDAAWREPPPVAPAVMQIVCILNGDIVNLTLGIIELVMMNDAEVRDYLRA